MAQIIEEDCVSPRTRSMRAADEFVLDENVITAVALRVPTGSVIRATKYRPTSWTRTARITAIFPQGDEARFFLKCFPDLEDETTVKSEFLGLSMLYDTMPTLAPRPLTRGKYAADSRTYFLLQEFIDFGHRLDMPDPDHCPDPVQLCNKLHALHSLPAPTNGMFGCNFSICQGQTLIQPGYDSSWTNLYTKLITDLYCRDHAQHPDWPSWATFNILFRSLTKNVIPRLLKNLRTPAGKPIQPALIHGDLWEGNTGTCRVTGDIYIFDPAPMYAHSEFDIGQWRTPYNKINASVYRETWLEMVGKDHPREEWDDRNRLYSIYFNLLYAVNHAGERKSGKLVREIAMDDMWYLVNVYDYLGECMPIRNEDVKRIVLQAQLLHGQWSRV